MAARGFSATARIARPSRVRATSQVRPTMSTTEMTRIATCRAVTRAPASSNVVLGKDPTGNRRVSGP